MKKLFFIFFLCACSFGVYAQSTSWSTTGNAGTSTSNFIGTIDNNPLIFRTYNTERMRLLSSNGNLGIGITTPQAPLHVHTINNNPQNITGTGYVLLMQLTTNKTGSGAGAGFSIHSGASKEILLKQNANAPFSIEGPGGGITILSDGNVFVGPFKAQSATVSGAISANALSAQSATVSGNTSINGNLGIGCTNPPLTKMQIGDTWTFYDGSTNKNIGRNTWNNGSSDVRIQQGVASRINFSSGGDINLQTAPTGSAGSTINSWNTVTMKNDGSVSIGTTTQQSRLEVNGTLSAKGSNISLQLSATNFLIDHTTTTDWNYASQVKVNRELTKAFTVRNSTTNTDVFVVWGNGVLCTKKIFTEKIEVTMSAMNSSWYDHVFEPEYNLRTLSELEQYIKQNKRLPEIPSAQDVKENGIDLGDMQGKLLLKVEELTLYIIELEKQIKALQQININNK